MTGPTSSKLEEVLAARRAQRQLEEEASRPPTYDADLIPEAQYERTSEQSEIDRVLAGVGIIQAYNKWCGKSKPVARSGQTESIMISCPVPGHKDAKPSAWLNTEVNQWNCGSCDCGGDIFTIAGFRYNMVYQAGNKYKVVPDKFPELRRQMVKDLGYIVEPSKSAGVPDNVYLPAPVPDPISTNLPDPVVPSVAPVELASVTSIDGVKLDSTGREEELFLDVADLFDPPSFDWRKIVTEGTFLDQYMHCCIIDDAAEEYHFWNGLTAISVAAGREVNLFDSTMVYGNILTCIIGKTGDRKSRSFAHVEHLIEEALPYDRDIHSGVKILKGVASGEQLIATFEGWITDPTSGKALTRVPVTGLVEYSELSSLTSRASRMGSTLKDVIHDFADAKRRIATESRMHQLTEALDSYASFFTTTQPESLKGLLTESDTTSGFLNRWIFVTGKPKKRFSVGGAVVDTTPAVMPLRQIHAQVPRTIGWSQDALNLFDDHYQKVLSPIQDDSPMLGRIDLIEKKLILLLAINENLAEVSVDIVHKVILLHDYLVQVYKLTGSRVKGNPIVNEIYDELIRHLKNLTPKTKFGPTRRNLKDRIVRKNWDMQIVDKVLDMLEKEDTVEKNLGDPGKPGRKTEHLRWIGDQTA